ncbi:SDR family NAD(P)-dependent oxidoreductase [Geodermatophilus sabuli]|uniref:NAD(P)-dependent dehydrogenase, short-chain alcohol dehydrogenase family n=1 Tax=Geodermatophilus sabuli TaxID=1564158 RepID=A0A285EB10_9ACTN|nr:SDR family oxidoreductase [Geodermatophilus sabuli]MBB3085535.1 NAD(P)-dependent dehydrogenase (short-subunit alcohol dehydrogenase family) [Geodermatophilus sabuli]SNX96043.1 NAD(P)-dependent dehydrogenase, short-chain alcohol dehydrogenase family [Geodermatophilus sabuli]
MDKKVIVVGGASGVGAACVRSLAAAGASVVSLDLAEETGTAVAEAAGQRFLRCDTTDRDEVFSVVDQAAGNLGGLDALVHVAGILVQGPAEELTDEDWARAMDVNARGPMLTNQAAFPHLKKGERSSIANFASSAALTAYPNGAAYAASKGAVTAWTRSIAVEWAPFGIRANVIHPSAATPMLEKHRNKLSEEEKVAYDELIRQKVPLGGTFGDPDRDIAPVITFLVSDGARFMTGQNIAVNGGYYI